MIPENEIAKQIVDAAFHIHQNLGPGLYESVYKALLVYELKKRGLHVDAEVPIPIQYDGQYFEIGFRADLIVNDLVIVELKSIEHVMPVHQKQLLTYLRLTDKHLGLLINFGVNLLKYGIFRVVNNLPEEKVFQP